MTTQPDDVREAMSMLNVHFSLADKSGEWGMEYWKSIRTCIDRLQARVAELEAERDSLLKSHRILNIDGARLQSALSQAEARIREAPVVAVCADDPPDVVAPMVRAGFPVGSRVALVLLDTEQLRSPDDAKK